ncbi:MAG: UvrB/UvrC motif-containing protein, partial [Planctomycetota bacterium]|jgi:protein arginine kinase activator
VLVPLLEKVHGAANHKGDAPERLRAVLQSRREVAELEAELNQAINAEEYERAAELRDRIREMKTEGARES